MIFKSKLQIFAIIVWLLVVGVVTVQTYKEYSHEKAAVTATGEKREIFETYFKSIGVTTGLCLLAWGVPFFPGIGYRLSSGQPPLDSFDVGKNEKDPFNVNPWLASFLAGGFFLFWVGASLDGRLYVGGFTAVGAWAVLLTLVWSVKRLFQRKKA